MDPNSVVISRLPRQVVPDLEWVQTITGHQLRGAGLIYAELRFNSSFRYSTVAIARTVGECWNICRKSWFDPDVVVRNEGRNEIVATMPLKGTWAGIPVRPGDRRMITTLRWSRSGTWDTEDDWVIRYHNTSEFGTIQARVDVAAAIAHLPELPLLITLGWYIKVLEYRSRRLRSLFGS